MKPRIDVAPSGVMKAMAGLEQHVRSSRVEPKLLQLVRMRASQINGCAYCLDMHSKDARADGESEQRLYELDAWRETPFYTERERAALEWTEAITLIHQSHAPDEVFEHVRQHFNDDELVALTLAIVAINGWNRLAIGFRAVPGSYQVPATPGRDQPMKATGTGLSPSAWRSTLRCCASLPMIDAAAVR